MALLTIQAHDALPLVSLDGELDTAEIDVASAALMGALIRDGRLVVDLDRLRFLDCAGVGLLIGVQLEAQRCRMPFVLARPSPRICRLLTLAGALDLLQVYGRLDEALDAAGVPPRLSKDERGEEGPGRKDRGWTNALRRNSWRSLLRSYASPTRSSVHNMS